MLLTQIVKSTDGSIENRYLIDDHAPITIGEWPNKIEVTPSIILNCLKVLGTLEVTLSFLRTFKDEVAAPRRPSLLRLIEEAEDVVLASHKE